MDKSVTQPCPHEAEWLACPQVLFPPPKQNTLYMKWPSFPNYKITFPETTVPGRTLLLLFFLVRTAKNVT